FPLGLSGQAIAIGREIAFAGWDVVARMQMLGLRPGVTEGDGFAPPYSFNRVLLTQVARGILAGDLFVKLLRYFELVHVEGADGDLVDGGCIVAAGVAHEELACRNGNHRHAVRGGDFIRRPLSGRLAIWSRLAR